MPAEKMHKDEVDTDAASLGRLLANQFPQWADLPIEPVAWSGGERTAEDARVEHVASCCVGEGPCNPHAAGLRLSGGCHSPPRAFFTRKSYYSLEASSSPSSRLPTSARSSSSGNAASLSRPAYNVSSSRSDIESRSAPPPKNTKAVWGFTHPSDHRGLQALGTRSRCCTDTKRLRPFAAHKGEVTEGYV